MEAQITVNQTRREALLNEAARLTCGERNAVYGEPKDNLDRMAKLFNAYFGGHSPGSIRSPSHDMAMVMVIAKLARIAHGKFHKDNYTDLAAYIAIAYECEDIEQQIDSRTAATRGINVSKEELDVLLDRTA